MDAVDDVVGRFFFHAFEALTRFADARLRFVHADAAQFFVRFFDGLISAEIRWPLFSLDDGMEMRRPGFAKSKRRRKRTKNCAASHERSAAEHRRALVKAFEGVEKNSSTHIVYASHRNFSPGQTVASDPRYVERFEIFIAHGMRRQLVEQNDPFTCSNLRKAYKSEERDAENPHLDFDFIEALEYGMPADDRHRSGIERMAMIFTGQENIDESSSSADRPSVGHINAQIYGIANKLSHRRKSRTV